MSRDEPITLKQVQLRLGVPQHVLIHLCEKGVIEPDIAETSGRGTRREFSERNLYEFALALALRKLELSVATTALVVRLVRTFARATRRAVPGFEMPGSLVDSDLELALYLHDDGRLVFSAHGSRLQQALRLRVNIDAPSARHEARPRVAKLDQLPQGYEARLELNLTRIAQKLLNRP